jgi:hypothetical protein
MPIYQVSLNRDSMVVERALVDIEAPDEEAAKLKALNENWNDRLDWRFSHTLSSQWPTINTVEILADGDEKISPRPRD